jgi:ribonuclease G
MTSEILVNSNNREIRVALTENNLLAELFIEHRTNKGIVGNIYKGKITKVLPGMQVAFVDMGLDKAGFLCANDVNVTKVHEGGKKNWEIDTNNLTSSSPEEEVSSSNKDLPIGKVNHLVPIQDLLEEGQEIIVQVTKNPLGTKGARITNYIGLPGRYLVYLPTANETFVSRRIEDESERERLKIILQETGNPEQGYIVRTAGQYCEKNDFTLDLVFLHRLWDNLQKKLVTTPPCNILYEDLNLTFRSIRDLFTNDVSRILVDSEVEYQSCLEFCESYLPHIHNKVELYQQSSPIFDHFGIETEINRALDRKVWLKSGGYILIDETEALVAIDVNTGKYVGHSNPEETILKTNLEAVKEVVCQLRLRNIGGIIIVDFIDMLKEESKETVWNVLTQSLKGDRSRTKILKISELGLVEMTRKRARESLAQTLCTPCSYCDGKGHNKSPTTICNEIIRSVERLGSSNYLNRKNVEIEVHPCIHKIFLEEESSFLEQAEQEYGLDIKFLENHELHQEKYNITINQTRHIKKEGPL